MTGDGDGSDPGRLDGCVALVTGASSGIGRAVAVDLAACGVTVAVTARRADRLDDLVAEVASGRGTATAVPGDLTDPAAAAAIVAEVAARHGRLDIVVNNAGVMLLGPALGAPLDEWDRMVALNVSALLHVTHAALPHLLEAATGPRGCADLVNVSSVAGRRARANAAVYNLTKFGVGAFTEALRQELAGRHVRVAAVEPGAVATELPTHIRPEIRAEMTRHFTDVEILRDTDIAEAVRYIVTRPRHAAVNEVLIRPTEQVN